MSFPQFGDFDKNLNDIFDKDFDLKYSFKSKASGPSGTSFTSTSAYVNNKIEGKFALKWNGPSGVTFDEIELDKDGAISSEISHTGVVPGLKTGLKLKGTAGNLNFTYKVPTATVFASVDTTFTKASVSLFTGKNGINAGAEVNVENKAVSGYNFGLGYSAAPKLNLAIRASDKLTNFSTRFSYAVNDDLTVAANANYNVSNKTHGANLASIYQCNPNTTLKVKATSDGSFFASAKQQVDKLSITGAVKIQKDAVATPSFGLNLVLG